MDFSTKYRLAAMLTGLAVLVFFVWYFHVIVFYILAAAVLSLVGGPLVDRLSKVQMKGWTMPRSAAAGITLIALLVGIAGLVALFVPIVVEQVTYFSSLSSGGLDVLLREPLSELQSGIDRLLPSADISVRKLVEEQVQPLLSSDWVPSFVGSVTSATVDTVVAGFSISFISFFFLKDKGLFAEGVLTLFPKRYEEGVARAMGSSTKLLVRYFIGLLIESLIKLVVVTTGALIIGFDFSTAALIGLVTAVLNVIPYIGPIIGVVFALLMAVVSPVAGVSLGAVVWPLTGVLLIFQLLDNIVLQPYIYSSSVKAHALEIFLVILMAGYIAGIWGMLLAIPAYTVLRVFAKEFFNHIRVVQKLTQKI